MQLDPAPQGGGGGGSGGSAAGGSTSSPAPGAGSSPAGASGGAPAIPAGQRLVSDADYAARDGAYGALTQLGLKADELANYGPVLKAIRDGGHDLGTVAKVLGHKASPQAATKSGEQQQPTDTRAAVREELAAERREAAEREHTSWANGEFPKVRENLIKTVLGENPDEPLAKLVGDTIDWRLANLRATSVYPEGHVLAGMPGRVSEQAIQQLTTDLKSIMDALAARDLKAIGRAANQPPSSKAPAGAAGNPGGQGGPDGGTPAGQLREIPREELLEEVRKELRANELAAAGATVG